MLLVRHQNHRITIESTFFSPLRTRSWPKLGISLNDQDVFCALVDVNLSDPPRVSFNLVAGYDSFDKELLQADQRLVNRFKKTHVEKSMKIVAEVVDVLLENSLCEITPEFSKVVSILAFIPATLCSAERSFSGLRRLRTYIRNTTGQHRLNSLAIICIERAYESQVIVNSMDKMIDIFGQRHGRKNFFL